MPTKRFKNQGQFFSSSQKNAARCIGEQKKKKIRVESVGREKKSPPLEAIGYIHGDMCNN